MKLIVCLLCLLPFCVGAFSLENTPAQEVVELYRASKISKNDILNYFSHPKYPFVIKELLKANKEGKIHLLWHVEDRNGKNIFDHYATAFKVVGEGEDLRYTWRETAIAINARDHFIVNRNKNNDFKIAVNVEVLSGNNQMNEHKIEHQQIFAGLSYQENLDDRYFLRAFLGAKKLLSVEYLGESASQRTSSSFHPEISVQFGRWWRKVRLAGGIKNTNVLSMTLDDDLLLKFINATAFVGELDYSLSPTFAAKLGINWFTSLLNDQSSGLGYRIALSYLPKWWPDFSLDGAYLSQILSTPGGLPDNEEHSFALGLNYRW